MSVYIEDTSSKFHICYKILFYLDTVLMENIYGIHVKRLYLGIQLHFACYNKGNAKYSSFENSNVLCIFWGIDEYRFIYKYS